MTITDPAHAATAAVLRAQFQHRQSPPASGDEGMIRDLGDYDRAFGLDTEHVSGS